MANRRLLNLLLAATGSNANAAIIFGPNEEQEQV